MQQPTFFDRVNPEPVEPLERVPYARGSHSSWKAAQRLEAHPEKRQTRTCSYLALLAARGPTIDETAAALLRCKQSSICSIRCNLSERGLIRKAGEQVAPQTGEDCTAWELTDTGRRQVDEARWRMDEKRA